MKKRDEELKMALKESYAHVAENASSSCSVGCCTMAANPEEIGKKIGYNQNDMQTVPSGSNLGLGCGNPIAFAALKEGERVLDLGSGAGIDAFLASNIVGSTGSVIGVDMTAEMVKKARENSRDHRLKGGCDNVEFRVGEIESLPVQNDSIDIVISNCAINLVPDKELAFREAFRVLKPGGRLMVSDIVFNKRLPDFVLQSIEAQVGCVAGASNGKRYIDAIRSAGFDEVMVIKESDFPLDCMANDPAGQAISLSLRDSAEEINKLEGSISSILVSALKPEKELFEAEK